MQFRRHHHCDYEKSHLGSTASFIQKQLQKYNIRDKKNLAYDWLLKNVRLWVVFRLKLATKTFTPHERSYKTRPRYTILFEVTRSFWKMWFMSFEAKKCARARVLLGLKSISLLPPFLLICPTVMHRFAGILSQYYFPNKFLALQWYQTSMSNSCGAQIFMGQLWRNGESICFSLEE